MNESITVKIVKKYDPELINTLKQMETDSFGVEAAANQWLLPVIINYGRVVVAIRQNKIIGVCLAFRDWNDSFIAFIHSFHIHKDCRGQGWGDQFFIQVIKLFKADKIKRVQLTVDPQNRPAVELYKKHGFSTQKVKKDEYGSGHDRLAMELKL
ncbi:MAG: GNAT family N-acetyltransferase [Actinomycetia bacterium]|nr:GNAT family N-acetyltransferase [Actinomycetes bacterium]